MEKRIVIGQNRLVTKEIIQDFSFLFFFRVHIPFWSRSGTEDLELGEINVLRMNYQFLEERESDFSLFEILSK